MRISQPGGPAAPDMLPSNVKIARSSLRYRREPVSSTPAWAPRLCTHTGRQLRESFQAQSVANSVESAPEDTLSWFVDSPEYVDQKDRGYIVHPVSDPKLFASEAIAADKLARDDYFLETSFLPIENDPNAEFQGSSPKKFLTEAALTRNPVPSTASAAKGPSTSGRSGSPEAPFDSDEYRVTGTVDESSVPKSLQGRRNAFSGWMSDLFGGSRDPNVPVGVHSFGDITPPPQQIRPGSITPKGFVQRVSTPSLSNNENGDSRGCGDTPPRYRPDTLGGNGASRGKGSSLFDKSEAEEALYRELFGELPELGEGSISEGFGSLNLRFYYDGLKLNMGMSKEREIPIAPGDVIAERFEVTEALGTATSSRVFAALDRENNIHVCLKVIKNDKDYFDQSLNEIKLLQFSNERDPQDKFGLLRLIDYFYFHEHLVLITELLLENLYEWQNFVATTPSEPKYFTLPVVQKITRQVLTATAFLHNIGLIHNDLKPENVAILSYDEATVKLIDLGAARHSSDRLSTYVQSRSYRAPEVILGIKYGPKIDVWSVGTIVAELLSGTVLFQNTSAVSLLARLESILGPIPMDVLQQGRYSNRFYTRDRRLYMQSKGDGESEEGEPYLLQPKRTTLQMQVPEADDLCLDFLTYLLTPDASKRPSALEALRHPWLSHEYHDSLPE